jgi:predicted O-methyltransferase YrrM
MDINLDAPGYGTDLSIFGGYNFKSQYGDVPAYCLDFTREYIKNHLNTIKNGIFVEIGVFGGSTLLDIYDICQKNNILIYGIDPWDKISIFNGISSEETNINVKNQEINRYLNIKTNLYKIIKNNNLKINLINDNSCNVYDNFNNNSIDCIHIDGDHSYNGVKNDLNFYWSKIKNGGMIINDDYHWLGCKKAIDEFIKINNDFILNKYTIQNGEKHVIIKK